MLHDRLFRLLAYAKDGTLYARLARWLAEQRYERRERRWQRRVVTKGILPYHLEGGTTLNLYQDDRLSMLIFVENFEADERAFVHRYLKKGDIFVDVGANIGLFTLIAARGVGPSGKVYALEPTTATYERLRANIEHNHLANVICFSVALSDKDEERLLMTALDGYGAWNSLAQPTAGAHFRKELIQCVKWDTFAAQQGLTGRVTLMKVDIEGWEFYMVQGAQATLCRADAPDLLVEFTEVNANAAGVTGAAVYELLVALGYKLYHIDAGKKTLHPATMQAYEWDNLLATKRIEQVVKRTGYRYATE